MTPSYDASWNNTSDPQASGDNAVPLSPGLFAGLIGCVVLGGFLTAASGAFLSAIGHLPWGISIIAILGVLLGIEITTRTEWRGSLFGHALSSVSFGLAAAPLFLAPTARGLRAIAMLIILGTTLLTVLAFFFPRAIRGFGTFLIGTAGATALSHIVWPLLATRLNLATPGLMHYLAAALALAYLDFYWTQALALPATIDNVIDSACALYIDVPTRIMNILDQLLGGGQARR